MVYDSDNNKENTKESTGSLPKKKVLIKKTFPKVVVKKATVEGLKTCKETEVVAKTSVDKAPLSSSLGVSSRPLVSARPSFSRPASMAGRLEENTISRRPAGGENREGGRSSFHRREGSFEGRGGYKDSNRSFNNRHSDKTSSSGVGSSLGGGAYDKRGAERRAKAKKEFASRYDKRDQEAEAFLSYKRKKADSVSAVPKCITMMESITISDLAKKMNLKASELISKLFGMGMMVTINQMIDSDTASLLASEYGCEVQVLSLYEETVIAKEEDKEEDKELRSPIVTVMGHVDHGKTRLLDTIHSLDVISAESGGITQHIGAYTVETGHGSITFLDTPGHEAFTMMRARGAHITDIVVLVVAADDGVMPQTVEAIQHAKEANVPIIVAINKMDLPTANPDRVKQQLCDHGLVPESWGGTTAYVEVSAWENTGIKDLLDAILLQAEIMEIKANPHKKAAGHILEAKIDPGHGVVCTLMVQEGTLRVGDAYVGGVFAGRVRALFDWRGVKIEEAGPSTPVEILGFDGLPEAGDPFQVTHSERVARQIAEKRQELKRQDSYKHIKKVSLATIHEKKDLDSQQELKVIIKGDVQGSVEALKVSLEKLSTQEIILRVIQSSAGAITESDVNFAVASGAIIIGFHVRPTSKAQVLADNNNVEILRFNIIYDAIESVRVAMEGMLEPELHERELGEVEVRKLFKVPKVGLIAGCYVLKGSVKNSSFVRVMREGVQVYEGRIASLRRKKEDAKEVSYGYECGIGLENFQGVLEGDILEVYEMQKVARKL